MTADNSQMMKESGLSSITHVAITSCYHRTAHTWVILPSVGVQIEAVTKIKTWKTLSLTHTYTEYMFILRGGKVQKHRRHIGHAMAKITLLLSY